MIKFKEWVKNKLYRNLQSILKNKKIIFGVTGSISAYKSPLIVRELIKAGAEVNVVLTPSALNFVTLLVMANLSHKPVIIEMFDEKSQTEGAWHILLTHNADAMLIAPCSATTISRIANGLCDTALSTLAIALPRHIPLIIAPAMDSTMLMHPATQENIKKLIDFGVTIIPPEDGELSSGLIGPGRLPEINNIIEQLTKIIGKKQEPEISSEKKNNNFEDNLKEKLESSSFTLQDGIDKDKWSAEFELHKLKNPINALNLANKKELINAGPTYENIDSVRFIGNYSSGKMGFELAEHALNLGAEVTLISGPVNLTCSESIVRIDINSAEQMYHEVIKAFSKNDIIILAAAVADFTPKIVINEKIKKNEVPDNFSINLIKTKDILAECGKMKNEIQKLIGFALETSNEIINGWKKLKEKNCDYLIVNSANKPQSGFHGDNNTITILSKDNTHKEFPPLSKKKCAEEIFKFII